MGTITYEFQRDISPSFHKQWFRFGRTDKGEDAMLGKSVQKRRIIHTEDILDLARSRADRLADFDATHESYPSGGEMSMMPGPLGGTSDLETGRTEQMVIERPDHRQEDRVIFDPLKPMIRKVAPAAGFVSSTEFPTEWTLVQ